VTITERLAFPAPVDTVDALLAAVRTLLGRALHRPQSRGRAARGLRLLVHLEGGHTWESRISFREPVGSAERMLVALKPRIEAASLHPNPSPNVEGGARLGYRGAIGGMGAPFTEVELSLLGLCGESALQGNLFTSQRGRQLDRVAEAARQLKARYGRPILAKVVEVEPWSRIPERRFALIDYDP
jgi:DNA polymerase-4/protein ImuB